MTVNGLRLPDSYIKFFNEYRYSSWDPKEGVDANGNRLDTNFMPYGSLEGMEEETKRLAHDFGVGRTSPEEVQSWSDDRRTLAGFIPYIADFSQIACFGRSACGAPFCFDYRDNARETSVIHWQDYGSYWRRIAPDFQSFISLLERYEEEEDEQEED
jgi:hypothetical protein